MNFMRAGLESNMRNSAALLLPQSDDFTDDFNQRVSRFATSLLKPDLGSWGAETQTSSEATTGDFAQRSNHALLSLQIPREPEEIQRPYTLHALQEWEGRVVSISGENFTGILVDASAGDQHETEKAEFPLEDVSPADGDLLRVGAIFRWVIGYQVLQSGNRQRVSQVVFRRLPSWRKQDLTKATGRTRALAASLREADPFTHDAGS